jgi:hypothetical protein
MRFADVAESDTLTPFLLQQFYLTPGENVRYL